MRFRTRGAGDTGQNFAVRGGCFQAGGSPPCPVAEVTVATTASSHNESMVDTDNPGFYAKSASGELVFNPMWRESYIMSRQPTRAEWTFTGNNGEIFDHAILKEVGASYTRLLGSTNTSAMDAFLLQYNSEREIAITSAWANVDESEMLALASIGEMPETIRFVASLYTRMIKVLALFRARKLKLALKRKLMKPVAFADAMANFWLEMRYAVRPLAFEMEQLTAALSALDKPMRRTARGFYTRSEITDNVSQIYVGPTVHLHERSVVSRSSSYRAGVLYQVGLNAGGIMSIFGFDKPLESIYELTKLSFVLDWFFNVGDLLASWTPSSYLTPLGSWCTEEHVFSTARNHQDLDYTGTWTEELTSMYMGSQTEKHRLQRRTISPDKPVYPHVDINLDVAKIVDLLAIARSIYRGIH